MDIQIRLHRGEDVLALTVDPEFRRAWGTLHAACAWATAFQDAPFADIWYRSYRSRYTPLVVTGWTDGGLTGLLLLAVSTDGGALCHVGDQHAEYQAWLGTDARFVEAALDALAAEFPAGKLRFLFLPPGAALQPSARWRTRCFSRTISRPLLSTSPADTVRESLRKKANKSKINRLNRLGKITFERVTDDVAFAALLDEMIPMYDLRQGAAHDALPFRDDDLKKAFYLALKRHTDLLHVTALRVDGDLAAAHVGVRNCQTVLVGMPAQSPRYSRHSAGKLLFFELALLLEQEGVDALDLTPGGDYKDRFASHADEASTLTIFFSSAGAWKHRQQRRLIELAKRRGVSTDRVKSLISVARHTYAHLRPADAPLKAARMLTRAVWRDTELRVYRFPLEHAAAPAPTVRMRRDCFADLVRYAPAEGWQPTTAEFLRVAVARLENGEHCYTHVEDGVLAHHGWLVERQATAFMDDVGQSWELPAGSAVLYGYYTHPRFRGRGMYRSSLGQMVRDAMSIPDVQHIYLCVRASNTPSRRVIEKVGFVHDRSFHEQRRFATVRRWSEMPSEPRAATPGRAGV